MPVTDYHPELDAFPLLVIDYHCKFQMLLGMLQWMLTIGKPELCQVFSSLSRFGAFPREVYLDLAVRYVVMLKLLSTRKLILNQGQCSSTE